MLLKDESNGRFETEEEARLEVRKMVERYRREELRIMLQAQGKSTNNVTNNLVPKKVKESVFCLYKITHYLYTTGDEYRLPVSKALADIQTLLYDPIILHAT